MAHTNLAEFRDLTATVTHMTTTESSSARAVISHPIIRHQDKGPFWHGLSRTALHNGMFWRFCHCPVPVGDNVRWTYQTQSHGLENKLFFNSHQSANLHVKYWEEQTLRYDTTFCESCFVGQGTQMEKLQSVVLKGVQRGAARWD